MGGSVSQDGQPGRTPTIWSNTRLDLSRGAFSSAEVLGIASYDIAAVGFGVQAGRQIPLLWQDYAAPIALDIAGIPGNVKAVAASADGWAVAGQAEESSYANAIYWDNQRLRTLAPDPGYSKANLRGVSGDGQFLFGSMAHPQNWEVLAIYNRNRDRWFKVSPLRGDNGGWFTSVNTTGTFATGTSVRRNPAGDITRKTGIVLSEYDLYPVSVTDPELPFTEMTGCTMDGKFAIGNAFANLSNPGAGRRKAILWSKSGGVTDLKNYLQIEGGVPGLTAVSFLTADAIDVRGGTITGLADDGTGTVRRYRVNLRAMLPFKATTASFGSQALTYGGGGYFAFEGQSIGNTSKYYRLRESYPDGTTKDNYARYIPAVLTFNTFTTSTPTSEVDGTARITLLLNGIAVAYRASVEPFRITEMTLAQGHDFDKHLLSIRYNAQPRPGTTLTLTNSGDKTYGYDANVALSPTDASRSTSVELLPWAALADRQGSFTLTPSVGSGKSLAFTLGAVRMRRFEFSPATKVAPGGFCHLDIEMSQSAEPGGFDLPVIFTNGAVIDFTSPISFPAGSKSVSLNRLVAAPRTDTDVTAKVTSGSRSWTTKLLVETLKPQSLYLSGNSEVTGGVNRTINLSLNGTTTIDWPFQIESDNEAIIPPFVMTLSSSEWKITSDPLVSAQVAVNTPVKLTVKGSSVSTTVTVKPLIVTSIVPDKGLVKSGEVVAFTASLPIATTFPRTYSVDYRWFEDGPSAITFEPGQTSVTFSAKAQYVNSRFVGYASIGRVFGAVEIDPP